MNRVFCNLIAFLAVGTVPLLAAETAATVTEAVNKVSHGTSQTSSTAPATKGTQIQAGEYLETGVKSRAELQLADQTITRLGANTVFNYSVANNEVDLQSGTILFSKPKEGKPMTIKTSAVTAAIVGTTGFLQLIGKHFIFGLVEGHATLTIGGVTYPLGPGEVIRLTNGAPPSTFFFNLSAFVSSSPLMTGFHSQLPNQPFIDKEVAEFNELVSRGFVSPITGPYFNFDLNGAVPTVPIPGTDSAGSAHGLFNTPPPPPPPPRESGPSSILVHPAPTGSSSS
jgi:hypothetical protein